MSTTESSHPSFLDLKLPKYLLKALDEVGYETPSPIQSQTIPYLLQGRDLLGHAPTGTGKTAAFALPLLSRLDTKQHHPQVLVLTPTRELAIQVAEAFQRYASHIKGFHVLPVYGGQDYSGQIRQLKRGVHVVVGTPGRVMDHMRRGTLRLDSIQALVLDEADEMLRMGFIDDVEWILEQAPDEHQTALFSATMPKEIQRIARRHLNRPREIAVKSRTATADTIRQRFWLVNGLHKLDALTRILEVEPFDAILIFVRTKTATGELAERLEARGYSAAALNGDMVQKQREQMVERLKRGSLDILVATDVAARGLDVERISHVINFDIPYDTEAYIHRIGRTGRAGRRGDAILFVAPRERRMLSAIEKATRQKIESLELPTHEMVNNKRIADFKQRISDTIAEGELAFMQGLLEQYQQEHDVPALEIAAALAKLSMGDRPLLLAADGEKSLPRDKKAKKQKAKNERNQRRSPSHPAQGMERFRLEVGHRHQVKPGNIVGAIANEAGLDAQYIGAIDIQDDFTLVDLPVGMPQEIYQDLKKAWICGQRMEIKRLSQPDKGKKTPRKRKRVK
ncbi:MAG: ATP-dependent RNA helicase [gamma proteobacterium symbiont of Ctena orbiculata]|uniref:ATP-dependent RNA helicase DeaD n=1 Tax=Candidatus Thiodiazotropha taylori TaxID=2792791 RepID=A0A944MHG2_9GAMM|nr:DEAD/DEAH box helicase [Candidatus Thiodiazotropha taylori]PUB89496.1 MAG: ATP-dependent RNA helicase [gamma proteobacterium symbiont of Ctena orbiculata]MBT2991020.1 DEAD/DEAH box helicase [Candidatus Thiodiazotropha taylori]MBT2997805.1 DEAD/DEAH box helicase [Candidatus Thiodiazotropha taylori]MBT3000426.1 DEAD/DEAH box helicase [Candidatus Thiodiazotropha taylori]